MRPNDPYHSYCFTVEMDGLPVASFQSVSGLEAQIPMTEYREGTDPFYMRKLPGMARFESNLVLVKGYTQANGIFWQWFDEGAQGRTVRRDGSIILCDEAGEDRIRWNFEAAWLTTLTGAEMDAGTNDIAVGRAEMVYERLYAAFLG